MKKYRILISALITTLFISCNNNVQTIKFKLSKENTLDAQNKIKTIEINDFLGFGEMTVIDSFFIYTDFRTFQGEEAIHIYNAKDFSWIKSLGTIGRGPKEITRIGSATFDNRNRNLWFYDYGREVRWCFNLDSMITINDYFPYIKKELNHEILLIESGFINDSTLIGTAVIPLSANSMKMTTAMENINTSEIKEYGYRYINSDDRYDTYSSFNLSLKNRLYVNAYKNIDCLSLCDLNGELVYNFVGENINKTGEEYKLYEYFTQVQFYKDYIIGSYLGEPKVIFHKSGEEVISPNKLLLFNIKGKFVKALNIGEGFTSFCIDEERDRIIFSFEEREKMFGYININELELNK